MSNEEYWQFCEIIERTRVTSPTIATAPETEKVVLEQHTGTGEYRIRPLEAIIEEAKQE